MRTKSQKAEPKFVSLLNKLDKQEVWFDDELTLLCLQHAIDPDSDEMVATLFDEGWQHQLLVSRQEHRTVIGGGGFYEWIDKPGICRHSKED